MFDSINKELYSSSDGVRSYINTTLQAPEVSILVKYKDAYYDKKILDIGCGAGRTSHYFRNFTHQYIGVDYSKPMVDFCKNQYPDLAFEHCDARDLSRFDDGEFDFVMFSYNGIDYIGHDDRMQVLDEIQRVLKKGGVFVFSAHNRKYNHIILKPKLQLTLHPVRLLKNVVGYYKQEKNHKELISNEVHNKNFSILNDNGNNFGLLTYYIDRHNQTEQLTKKGFKLLEMFQLNGQALLPEEDDSDSGWIYYVSEKI